ncbi:MAG: WecB/TagA/CpsF family glycosyltransferase [Spirochaetota bacterium]
MKRLHMLNVAVDTCLMDEAVDAICAFARGERRSTFADRGCAHVYFFNAHCGNVSARVPAYKEALDRADLVFPDGSGIKLGGMIQGTPIEANVNGTDLFPLLMEALAREGRRVFFVGAKRRVIASLVQSVPKRWPGVELTGWTVGYFDHDSEVTEAIKSFGADVVFVAMGVPRQELWIDRCMDSTGAKVAIAVGGLFDFYSGVMPRAPLWMRRLGVEWLFRLAMEPRRMWKRYILGNFEFMARVIARRRRGSKP